MKKKDVIKKFSGPLVGPLVQITFRHLRWSPSVRMKIRERAEELSRFYPRITSIHVVVEPTSRKHHQGNTYQVHLHMTIPGREIVVSHNLPKDQAHEDAYVAIRDTFDAAQRRLEDYVSSLRGNRFSRSSYYDRTL